MFRWPTSWQPRLHVLEQRACGRNPTHQRRATKPHGFRNPFVEGRGRFSHRAGQLRERVLCVSQMQTRRAHEHKKQNAPLRRSGAQHLHVFEKRPQVAREVQLVQTLKVPAPCEEVMVSGPSRQPFEFRDQPNEIREASALIVGPEQVVQQTCAVGQRFFSNHRERVFPGFEGRFRFATVHVGHRFVMKHVPRQ